MWGGGGVKKTAFKSAFKCPLPSPWSAKRSHPVPIWRKDIQVQWLCRVMGVVLQIFTSCFRALLSCLWILAVDNQWEFSLQFLFMTEVGLEINILYIYIYVIACLRNPCRSCRLLLFTVLAPVCLDVLNVSLYLLFLYVTTVSACWLYSLLFNSCHLKFAVLLSPKCLQSVQNVAARLLTGTLKHKHIIPHSGLTSLYILEFIWRFDLLFTSWTSWRPSTSQSSGLLFVFVPWSSLRFADQPCRSRNQAKNKTKDEVVDP